MENQPEDKKPVKNMAQINELAAAAKDVFSRIGDISTSMRAEIDRSKRLIQKLDTLTKPEQK